MKLMKWINYTQNLSSKIFLIIAGTLIGCILIFFSLRSFNLNGLETYDEYLTYAFGDYEIVEKELRSDEGLEYFDYTISYKDKNQQVHKFIFNNEQVDNQNDLKNRLITHAKEIADPIFKKDYFNKFLPSSITSNPNGVSFSFYENEVGEITDELLNYHDKIGLSFVDFNIKGLKESVLGISISLSCGLDNEDIAEITQTNESCLAMVKQMYQDSNNQNIDVTLRYNYHDANSDSTIVITYIIEFDQDSQNFLISQE